MKNPSVSQFAHALVPTIKKPRSVFDRSHSYKTTFDADYLVPFYAKNVLPGDSVNLKHSIVLRLNSPTLRPLMDNLHLETSYFFVPYRIIWSNFLKFMGEQASPADSISYTVPQCTGPNVASGGITIGSLHDYFGLPTEALSTGGGTTGITFNNLWPRGYLRIWHDWFRDENLQNAPTLDLGDGPDTFGNYNLQKRNKKHDYITSALPWLQKVAALAFLPLGTSATVKTQASNLFTGAQSGLKLLLASGAGTSSKTLVTDGSGIGETGTAAGALVNYVYPSNLYADLSTASAATITALRSAISLQQFLENDARGGSRYVEIVRQRWGVVSPDARLQRTELLALHSTPIKFNPVAQTAPTFGASPSDVGTLAAFGTGVVVGPGFNKSFTEHGVIIGLVNVRADITYAQGLERVWSYRTRYDFFNPEFAHLSEQAILNKEVMADCPDGTGASQKDGVFGYIGRYDEERFSQSMVTGLMRPDATSSLAIWNLTEQFASIPTLNSAFIQSNASAPVDRAISVPSQPHFILDTFFSEKWARIMPVFGIPGLNRL